jgi:hypothetical protein
MFISPIPADHLFGRYAISALKHTTPKLLQGKYTSHAKQRTLYSLLTTNKKAKLGLAFLLFLLNTAMN